MSFSLTLKQVKESCGHHVEIIVTNFSKNKKAPLKRVVPEICDFIE